MKNRTGLIAEAEANLASGTAERDVAELLSEGLPVGATLAAHKINYAPPKPSAIATGERSRAEYRRQRRREQA